MEKKKKKSKVTVVSLCLLTSIVGGTTGTIGWLDGRYAMAEEQQTIKKEQTKLKVQVRINKTEQTLQHALANYYFQKKKKRQYPDDDELSDEFQKAKDEVSVLKKQIGQLKKKKLDLEHST